MRDAVDDLTDDWHRAGQCLTAEDVYRLASKRGLDPIQLAAVLTELSRAGISPLDDDLTDPIPDEVDAPGGGPPGSGHLAGTVTADLLKDYMRRIGRHDLIFAEDEVRLGREIRAGQEAAEALRDAEELTRVQRRALSTIVQRGDSAKTEFVQANLRLVVAIAKSRRYEGSGVELADRIQDGNIGLMRAVDKFDHTLGFKFSTYATWWIRQAIERGIGDRGRLIRIPIHFHEIIRKVRAGQRTLSSRQGRPATVDELAQHTGLPVATIHAAFDHDRAVVSFDTPLDAGDITLGDLLAEEADIDGRTDPVNCVISSSMTRDILGALHELGEREADVITRRFGLGGLDPMTLDEIGAEYGLTRERIRQIQEKTLDRLSSSHATRPLYEYLVEHTHQVPARPADGWPTTRPKSTKRVRSARRTPEVVNGGNRELNDTATPGSM